MRVIAKFNKIGAARYVAHLDLLRSMQRAFRRAGVPIAYSQGFNPHQIISFAAASSVGIASVGEWLDITLTQDMDEAILLKSLNDVSPEGLMFKEVHAVRDNYPALMNSTAFADYIVSLTFDKDLSAEEVDTMAAIAATSEIIAQKKGKKGIKEVDIGEYIVKTERVGDVDGNNCKMYFRLKHEPTGALNPNLLMPALIKLWGFDAKYRIERQDILAMQDGEIKEMWQINSANREESCTI